jgi:hypothetical protein
VSHGFCLLQSLISGIIPQRENGLGTRQAEQKTTVHYGFKKIIFQIKYKLLNFIVQMPPKPNLIDFSSLNSTVPPSIFYNSTN